mmetsp:Transcript_21747/g.35042  ORF Transcript_21747/g.35042 Transcript_21747/m.35042 type:complete len:96 (+) Transcript_21747:204-491(+)
MQVMEKQTETGEGKNRGECARTSTITPQETQEKDCYGSMQPATAKHKETHTHTHTHRERERERERVTPMIVPPQGQKAASSASPGLLFALIPALF